jgi:hypothetical protein
MGTFLPSKKEKAFYSNAMENWEKLLRGISKIDEFAIQLDQYNLKFVDEIKGFDPNHLFTVHMTYVGCNTSLANTLLFKEEEGDSEDPP